MITKDKAIEIVTQSLGKKMAVMPEKTLEKENVWVIYVQTKKYLETGDDGYMAVGWGGILVEKSTGKMHHFNTLTSLEQSLKILELGYLKYSNWDIEITKVFDIVQTTKMLLDLDLSYVIPEEAHGVTWKIAQPYTRDQLINRLKNLPARFNIGSLGYKYLVVDAFKHQKAFSYSLDENKGYSNCI